MTYRAPRHTQVTQIGDRIEIHTDPRRASAILQVLSGGTLQEVGDQLGVTRERIRQYLKDVGLTVAMRQRQVDHTERVARFQRGSRRRNRTHQKQRQRERLHRAAAWIQGFAAEEGRPPTLRELALAMVGKPTIAHLAGWCGATGTGGKGLRRRHVVRRLVHLAYRMAGAEPPICRGTGRHISPEGLQRQLEARRQWRLEHPDRVREIIQKMQAAKRRPYELIEAFLSAPPA